MDQNQIQNPNLDFDDNLKDDAAKFSIDGKQREHKTEDGFLIRETGVFLSVEACVRLSLDLYLGFPSDAIRAYYMWALDYLDALNDADGGKCSSSHQRITILPTWHMLRKEHTRYWNPRYHIARSKSGTSEKTKSLFVRMKIVHACRTVCRITLNSLDGLDWCRFVPRFLEYREIGLGDNAETDLGQGSGRHGAAKAFRKD